MCLAPAPLGEVGGGTKLALKNKLILYSPSPSGRGLGVRDEVSASSYPKVFFPLPQGEGRIRDKLRVQVSEIMTWTLSRAKARSNITSSSDALTSSLTPSPLSQSGEGEKTIRACEHINLKSAITNPQSEVPHPPPPSQSGDGGERTSQMKNLRTANVK